MEKIKFISNPFVRAPWKEVDETANLIVNKYFNFPDKREEMMEMAKKCIYSLGWSLEEYQESNRPQ
jgi:hypothetical protein